MLAELLLAVVLAADLTVLTPAATTKHLGPLGINWGKSPADARSVVKGRVTFVEERRGPDVGNDTIELHYSGTFGGLEGADMRLLFHRGEFFYLAVTLPVREPGDAVAAYEAAARKMTKAYGPALKRTKAPQVSSRKAILENVPLENRGWVLPMLWNEQTKEDAKTLHALRELQIRIAMWDPFAAWRFANGVTVQTFIYRFRPDGVGADQPATLVPIWIFSKDDRFTAWQKVAWLPKKKPKVVVPRDY